ncbi:Uncharacterised protein [Mycobacteroides abscessus subsp. abscessus]|nr:Uncharacterised protein [Mycobacteroides abscessus subsp. abscessus]
MKSGGGLHEIGSGGLTDPTCLTDRLGTGAFQQCRRLDDDLQGRRRDRVPHGLDIGLHGREVSGHRGTHVDHHVDLGRSCCDRESCLMRFDGRNMFPRRESRHCRDEEFLDTFG